MLFKEICPWDGRDGPRRHNPYGYPAYPWIRGTHRCDATDAISSMQSVVPAATISAQGLGILGAGLQHQMHYIKI